MKRTLTKVPTWRVKLILMVASSFLALAVPELLARLTYKPVQVGRDWPFEWDPDKLYRLKANWTGWFADRALATNSLGQRDDEISPRKPDGTVRIVFSVILSRSAGRSTATKHTRKSSSG
jgi:hypothetical protein